MTEEIVKLLKDSGCWGVQMGVESLSRRVRSEILNRQESDAVIERAFRLLDAAGYRGWITIDPLELTDRAGGALAGAKLLRQT